MALNWSYPFHVGKGKGIRVDGLAVGRNATPYLQGMSAHQAGLFVSDASLEGDPDTSADKVAQASSLIWMIKTTDATPTELLLEGTALQRAIVPSKKAWLFDVRVLGKGSLFEGLDDIAAFKFDGIALSQEADENVAILGLVKTTLHQSTGAASWDCAVDAVNNVMRITATGEAAKTVRWIAYANLLEVGGIDSEELPPE